ncbi:MAG: helix-turn-helix domain-containing protein [Nanoarchaeota archaeon]|nr:helix-turn-helix domain-containing protein [Nanoarchaeota archaeon]
MDTKILEEIGLTKSEISVYLALLELGSSATGKIIDKSKASSSKVYEILDRLMQKGLVSFVIKSGVKYFEAAPPERIVDYFDEKEKVFSQQKNELKKILPELELKQKLSKFKSEATIFKGIKGAETAFKQLISSMKKDDEWDVFVITPYEQNYYNLLTKLHEQRAKKGLKARMIFSESERERGKVREKIPNTHIKYVSNELKFPAVINVAGNITILNVPGGEEITLFMIDNKEVADSFRTQFEKLWQQDVYINHGLDGVYSAFNKMLDELKPGEEYYVLGASWQGQKSTIPEFFREFHKRRDEKGVRVNFLFVSGTEESVKRNIDVYGKLSEIKFLPQGIYEGVQINLYRKKVLIFVWREKEPVVFTIEDEKVYHTFMTYFKLMWEQDITVSKGFPELNRTLDNFLNSLEKGESYDVLGVTFGLEDYSFYDKNYAAAFKRIQNERIKRGIKARLLFQQRNKEMIDNFKEKIYKENYEAKVLPYKTEFPVAILPSNNKTVIIVHEKEPSFITINNKKVSGAFKKYFESIWNQEARILYGLDAVQDIFEDILESGQCDFIGARGYFIDARPKYIDEWEKKAIKKGFKLRNIVDSEVKGHRITKFSFTQTKYTLAKEFANLSVFWIYGNKVVISNWMKKEPMVIIIENKQLHDMYKQQFELLWNK